MFKAIMIVIITWSGPEGHHTLTKEIAFENTKACYETWSDHRDDLEAAMRHMNRQPKAGYWRRVERIDYTCRWDITI